MSAETRKYPAHPGTGAGFDFPIFSPQGANGNNKIENKKRHLQEIL